MAAATGYVRHHVYIEVIEDSLWVAEDAQGELYFPIRPTCTALELHSGRTIDVIKDDSRLNTGLREILLPTAGGEQKQQCLASIEYSWWLAVIDPRRFKEERRALLLERQRVLMQLARDIMLKRSELRSVVSAPKSKTPRASAATGSGQLEGHFRCLACGAPHYLVIDGQGWHLHVGVEVES